MRKDPELRDAAENRLARSLVGRDRMPGWRARLLSRHTMRPVRGQTEGHGSDVARRLLPTQLASSPERDPVRGIHDPTGPGRRRFFPVPVQIGRDGR
jgi:hypothetical protein